MQIETSKMLYADNYTSVFMVHYEFFYECYEFHYDRYKFRYEKIAHHSRR